ncbi:MAG TPA: hypothetical protein VKG45_02915 [Actinomycetes bacterium]|nr:hypothetical protein [Actinomycetes bacterium]
MTLVLVAAVVPGALADTEGDLASAQAPDTPAQVETGAEAGGASGTPSPPEAPASGGNTSQQAWTPVVVEGDHLQVGQQPDTGNGAAKRPQEDRGGGS